MAKSRSAPTASASKGQLLAVLAVFLVLVAVLWGVVLALGLRPQLGLDLRGGTSITMIPAEGQVVDDEILDQTVQVIRQRVDAIGVAEPDVARQGDTVLIQLPGVADQERALEIVGQTAVLQFRRVLEVIPPDAPNYDTVGAPCDEPQYVGPPPDDEEVVLCERERDPTGEDLPREEWTKYRLGTVEIRGERVTSANAQLDQTGFGGYEVALGFDAQGGNTFQRVTGELACEAVGSPARLFAIVLDDVIEMAAQVSPDVPCGQGIGREAIITVGGAQDDARQLALVLRTGSLPIQLEFATAQSISPTLGETSLQAGLQAGLIGLLLVGAYLLALYRGMGLAAIAELLMFGLIVYGLIIVLGEAIGFTLTLAGIAGIIVSIGIAADSSIIYRERYRDEIKAGRTVRTAADVAFRKAWRTNLTGNTVSFLAALALYVLAVGPVRGFAFTLGLSTLIDTLMFGTFTRSLFGLIARNPKLAQSRWMGLRVQDVSPTLVVDTTEQDDRTPARQSTGDAS